MVRIFTGTAGDFAVGSDDAELLTDIQNTDRGIYTEQYTVIADAAGNIANHPVMTPEDKELVKSALGSEIKRFVNFDRIVHHHADSMRIAALEENMQDVLHHYRIVQSGCVDCHSHYREKISDARSAQTESYEK